MLGKTRTTDTSKIGPRCVFTPHPAFFPRISWPKRVQTVWIQWLSRSWPTLWISHSSLIGPYDRSEPCTIIWTGPQADQEVGICLLNTLILQNNHLKDVSSILA